MTSNSYSRILIVRLGAMGDILHAFPAVASLRKSFPQARISWVAAPKWRALLEEQPDIDEFVPFRRSGWRELADSWHRLRTLRPDLAIDFQGLLQSALVAAASGAKLRWGWSGRAAREPAASLLYHHRFLPASAHVVDRNLELAAAAGATELVHEFRVSRGRPEGQLPREAFVLTHPFAGWASKQWPLENYAVLAARLRAAGLTLVANVAPHQAAQLAHWNDIHVHSSSIAGLIAATREAAAVVGLDSGPMHLAAALGKPGVALFGPTDPRRNGPYGETLRVLRASGAETTYKRGSEIAPSMRAISPEEVFTALMKQMNLSESRR